MAATNNIVAGHIWSVDKRYLYHQIKRAQTRAKQSKKLLHYFFEPKT